MVEDAKKRLSLITLRFEGGLDSEFSILDYEESLINTELKDLDFTYHQYAFTIRLMKVLGGGYNVDTLPIALEAP